MPSYNRLILMGNLVKAPELRYTNQTNTASVKVAVAVNRKTKNKDEVLFINAQFYGALAEVIHKYTEKGSPVHLEGRLAQVEYETKDGTKVSTYEMLVESIQLIDGKKYSSSPDADSPQ